MCVCECVCVLRVGEEKVTYVRTTSRKYRDFKKSEGLNIAGI